MRVDRIDLAVVLKGMCSQRWVPQPPTARPRSVPPSHLRGLVLKRTMSNRKAV